jgi:hypothetical protein
MGCATSVERRPAAAAEGSQGAAWEVVFPAPLLAEEPEADESARRDLALNPRSPVAVTALDEWPDSRPAMERQLRVHFSSNDRQVLFFRPLPRRPAPWWGR